MTVLSVFVDLHNINLLLFKSKDEFWFKKFPYVYNKSLFSASFSKDEFYLSLFTSVCSEHGVALETCDILICGFLDEPKFGTDSHSELSKKANVKLSTTLFEVIKKVEHVYPVHINNHAVFTKEKCYSLTSVRSINKPTELIDIDEENYYANLELYPQIVSNEIAVQIDIDTNIASLIPEDYSVDPAVPVVFCGARFSHNYQFKELDYLLILNFLNKPGVYDVRRDDNDALVLTTMLKMYDSKIDIDIEIPHEETVLVSKYTIDGAIQTQEGTSQLVHIDKNRLLVIPSAKEERINIKLKSRDLGNVDRDVEGSNIGLIFDTRDSKKLNPQDVKNFSVGIKNFKGSST